MLRMNPLKILTAEANCFIRSCEARGHAEPITSICAIGEARNLTKSSKKQNLIP